LGGSGGYRDSLAQRLPMNASSPSMAASRACPICGAAPLFAFEAKHLSAFKCSERDCGHIYATSAIPLQGAQKHFDPDAECRKYAQRDIGLVAFLVRINFLNADSRILDFGAGLGHLA